MKRAIVLMICLIVAVSFTSCGSAAKKEMKDAVKSANELLETDQKPYDANTKKALQKAVEESENAGDDDAYKKATKDIKTAETNYENSIEQLKQVTKPEESFLLERAKNVETITDVEAATEETDGNKMMNKEGGYYAYIALKSSLVDTSYYEGSTAEIGNDGGGAIEAFKTVKEAKARDEYLSQFDSIGGILSPGSHKVVGTLVIRTSDELTASQQKELETNIINALIELK